MITSFQNEHHMYHEPREMQLLTVERGIILPYRQAADGPRWGLGGVCDEDNRFVPLSAYDGGWATHGGKYEWEEETYLDEDVIYFGMFFNHWGHFLIDLIGRLWPFAKDGSPYKGWKLAYLGEDIPGKNFLEFFSLLGIEESDLIHITAPTRCRRVVVAEYCCKSCEWYSDEYRRIFDAMIKRVEREQFLPSLPDQTEKVYLARNAFGKAKGSEFGEETIISWMKANGFAILSPEKLSVREQIYLWNHAKEIVCLNGSIPMNVAFCANEALRLTVLNKTHLEHLNLELYLLMRPCQVTLLDVWYEPFKKYPKSIGEGPFVFYLGDDARTYSQQRGWVFPFEDKTLRRRRSANVLRMIGSIVNVRGRIRRTMVRIVPRKIKKLLKRGQ